MGSDKRCYQKDSSVVSRVIGEETLLVPIRNNTASMEEIYTLSGIGGRIWELIDRKRSVDDIKQIITKEFLVGPEEAGIDLADFIQQLEDEKCIKLTR